MERQEGIGEWSLEGQDLNGNPKMRKLGDRQFVARELSIHDSKD